MVIHLEYEEELHFHCHCVSEGHGAQPQQSAAAAAVAVAVSAPSLNMMAPFQVFLILHYFRKIITADNSNTYLIHF